MSCSIRISVIARIEREQQLGERDALAARESGRRLVEHHQRGFAARAIADLELALLAVREGADERRARGRPSPTGPASSRARSRSSRVARGAG